MMEYNGIKLPENLVSTIYRLTIEKVGIYNGAVHSFQIPTLDTTEQREAQIREVYDRYSNLDPFSFNAILNYVIDNVDASPRQTSPLSIVVEGEDAVQPLDHLAMIEENGARTDLIYVGLNRFYVLSTSKSTVLPGDILETRRLPINLREETSMNIYRNDGGKERFIPSGCEDYDPAVKFAPLTIIHKYTSPEIYRIIDREKSFGGELKTTLKESTLQSRLVRLKDRIVTKLADIDDAISKKETPGLPSNEKYPDYDEFLQLAMESGIPTYVLNILIESIERRPVNEYCFVEEDWDLNLTPEQVKEREEKKKREKQALVKRLENDLTKVLKEVTTRRVWLFFKAPGKITNPEYLSQIYHKLDALADEGFGHQKGWAKQEIDRAVASSKPAPLYNLKVGMILLAVILLASFTAYTWVLTKKSIEAFDSALNDVAVLAQDDMFFEAQACLDSAKLSFKPPYMTFVVSRKYEDTQMEIEIMIDEYVDRTIQQIETMRKANYGRIDKYCWGLIQEAMKFREDDERLNELRNLYIRQ